MLTCRVLVPICKPPSAEQVVATSSARLLVLRPKRLRKEIDGALIDTLSHLRPDIFRTKMKAKTSAVRFLDQLCTLETPTHGKCFPGLGAATIDLR